MIPIGGAATSIPRLLGIGAGVGAVEGAGRTEADLTEGEVSPFAKDVALGAGIGAGAGAAGVGATKLAPLVADSLPLVGPLRQRGRDAATDKVQSGILDRLDALENPPAESQIVKEIFEPTVSVKAPIDLPEYAPLQKTLGKSRAGSSGNPIYPHQPQSVVDEIFDVKPVTAEVGMPAQVESTIVRTNPDGTPVLTNKTGTIEPTGGIQYTDKDFNYSQESRVPFTELGRPADQQLERAPSTLSETRQILDELGPDGKPIVSPVRSPARDYVPESVDEVAEGLQDVLKRPELDSFRKRAGISENDLGRLRSASKGFTSDRDRAQLVHQINEAISNEPRTPLIELLEDYTTAIRRAGGS